MPVEKIVLQRGLTINTGNYENEKLEARVEYSVKEGQSMAEARADALDELTVLLLEEAKPLLDTLPEYRRERLLAQICPLKDEAPAPELIPDDKPLPTGGDEDDDGWDEADFDDEDDEDEDAAFVVGKTRIA